MPIRGLDDRSISITAIVHGPALALVLAAAPQCARSPADAPGVRRWLFWKLLAEAPTDQVEVLIAGHNRIFTDAEGKQWVAYEVEGSAVPAARGPHCLVFECDTTIRRVWNFPASWYELPTPDLWKVSWGV